MKQKYSNKITILATLIFHLLLIIGYLSGYSAVNNLSMFNFNGSFFGLIIGTFFLITSILGIWVVMIQLWLTYADKERNPFTLINAVINTIAGIIGMLLFINLDNLASINILFGVAIIGFIYNFLLILCLEGILEIQVIKPYLPVSNELLESTQQEPINVKNRENFFKTKAGKIVLAVLISGIVLFSGYKVWDTFFNKTTIDLFENVDVIFDGSDGEGYADFELGNIDYDNNNDKMELFFDSVYYEVENDGELSNGDTVTVTVTYSKKTAEGLKLKIKQDTMTFTVSGLTVKYKSASEIDKKLYDEAKNLVLEKVKSKNYGSNVATFYKAFYAVNSNSGRYSYDDNYLVFVFKNESKNYSGEVKTSYIYYEVEFDSSFNKKDVYLYPSNLYKADSFDYVDNEVDVLKALNEEYKSSDGYKIEEIN